MTDYSMVQDFISVNRRQGTTLLLIGALISHPTAKLVVNNMDAVYRLTKAYPTLKGRIFSLRQLDTTKGLSAGPVFFDTDAVYSLASTANQLDGYDFAEWKTEAWNAACRTAVEDKDYKLIANEDGYGSKNTKQLNVKMTEEDYKDIDDINRSFFENEASNSMLGRILLRKGIQFYKKLKESV